MKTKTVTQWARKAEHKAIELKLENCPEEFAGEKVAEINKLDGTKLIMEDGKSWLLMRESGTEPVVRLYGEAESDQKLNSLMEAGKELILS